MVVRCSKCKKSFADASRMEQHARDAHQGVSAPKKAKPKSKKSGGSGGSSRSSRAGMGRLVDSGVDLLSTLTISPEYKSGSKLFSIPISPANFQGRLKQEAMIWERWRPRKLEVEIIASGSAMTFGSLVCGWSADEGFSLGSMSTDVTRVLSLRPNVVVKANETKRFSVPLSTLTKWYLVHSHVGESHGSLQGVVMNPFGGFQSSDPKVKASFGVTIVLHWNMEFEGVALSMADEIVDIPIRADIGQDGPYFTTSDGSFNAKVLTFKEHSGQNMVSFQTAREGVVYTTKNALDKVKYYDGAGAEKYCKFFVRIPQSEYAIPGLLLFASKDDASTFVRTGDLEHCLQYYKQGEWCKTDDGGPTLYFVSVSLLSEEDEVESLRKDLVMMRAALAKYEGAGPSGSHLAHSTMDEHLAGVVRRKAKELVKTVAQGEATLRKTFKDEMESRPKGNPLDPVWAVPIGYRGRNYDERPIRPTDGASSPLTEVCPCGIEAEQCCTCGRAHQDESP